MNWLPLRIYRHVAAHVPLLCVDGIIGYEGKFLLLKRQIPPYQNRWWVPGGRVRKGERLAVAFRRILRAEVGIIVEDFTLAGVYEVHHFAPDTGIPGGRHVVSVVFETSLPTGATITLDKQHSAWRWAARLPRDFWLQESGSWRRRLW